MRSVLTVLSLCVVFVVLNGCASLSKDECLGGDWERIGYQDGVRGMVASRINAHSKACSDYSITPDTVAYQAARKKGLEQVYCKPENAYRLGLSGSSYNNVCPSYMRADFITAFRYGSDIHHLQKNVTGYRSRLHNIDTEIQDLDIQIRHTEDLIELHPSRKSGIRNRLHHHIEDELQYHQSRLTKKRQDLATVLRLNNTELQNFKDMFALANKKGIFKNRLNWRKDYLHHDKSEHGKSKRLQKYIDRLEKQILRYQYSIRMSRRPQQHRQSLTSLMRISEYIGELDSQLAILGRLEQRSWVKHMMRFHYAHAVVPYNRHKDQDMAHKHHDMSLNTLRSELRHARADRERLLRERHDIEHQISSTQQEIYNRKQTSKY